LKLGLVVQGDALRRELSELVRGWGGEVVEASHLRDFAASQVDIVLVEVGGDDALELASRPPPLFGLHSDLLFGLVPITLPSDLRTALRAHFRLLVNKPVHHDSFYALLAGSVGNAPMPSPPPHFGFRVLVVEDNTVNQRLVQRMLINFGCVPTS